MRFTKYLETLLFNMKKSDFHLKINLAVFLLFLCVNVSAQSQPTFSIGCMDAPRKVTAGETTQFFIGTRTALTKTPTYIWTLSGGGEIVDGQGTSEIIVQTEYGVEARITATVELGNVFDETRKYSCTIETEKRKARLIDEFPFVAQGDLKARMDTLYLELNNNPQDQGYIFIFPKTAADQARVERVVRDVIKWRNYDPSRVTIVNGEKGKRTNLQFWLKPPDADAPKPELNAEYRLPVPQNTVKANASACELNALYLENLQIEVANTPNQLIRIVFSPGKTETAAVNAKRQKIFMDKIKNRFPNVETQIGAKTEGEGEVAIYLKALGGEEVLYLLIYAIKNKSVCLNCCEPSDAPKSLLGRKRR